jgi:hypothetical protein
MRPLQLASLLCLLLAATVLRAADEVVDGREKVERLEASFDGDADRVKRSLAQIVASLEDKYTRDRQTIEDEFAIIMKGLAKDPNNQNLYAKAEQRQQELERMDRQLEELRKAIQPFVTDRRRRIEPFPGSGSRREEAPRDGAKRLQ